MSDRAQIFFPAESKYFILGHYDRHRPYWAENWIEKLYVDWTVTIATYNELTLFFKKHVCKLGHNSK